MAVSMTVYANQIICWLFGFVLFSPYYWIACSVAMTVAKHSCNLILMCLKAIEE
uniref:Uncharacterized protein n=1 Tax=Anopheles quadriannulatus TaxID=34691 RepID=A0A182XTM3_ANOQN